MRLALSRIGVLAAVMASTIPATAHHSSGMFDMSSAIWVKGTFARLDRINPHSLMTVDEKQANGKIQRWTVEGPTAGALNRIGIPLDFLKAGDEIELCAFALKAEYSRHRPSVDADGSPTRFVHGHMLVMPDGHMRLWGGYGQLENCIRPGDTQRSWVDFLNTDARGRDAWCNDQRLQLTPRATSKVLAQEINRRMAKPCA